MYVTWKSKKKKNNQSHQVESKFCQINTVVPQPWFIQYMQSWQVKRIPCIYTYTQMSLETTQMQSCPCKPKQMTSVQTPEQRSSEWPGRGLNGANARAAKRRIHGWGWCGSEAGWERWTRFGTDNNNSVNILSIGSFTFLCRMKNLKYSTKKNNNNQNTSVTVRENVLRRLSGNFSVQYKTISSLTVLALPSEYLQVFLPF